MWPKLLNFGQNFSFDFRPVRPKRNSGRNSKLWSKSTQKISFLGIYVTQKIKKEILIFVKKIIFVEQLSPKMEMIGIPCKNHVLAIYITIRQYFGYFGHIAKNFVLNFGFRPDFRLSAGFRI